MNAKLVKRVKEMNDLARSNGWTPHHEEFEAGDAPDAEHVEAVAWGAMIEIDDYEFTCMVALGINPYTGRVITLVSPRHGERVIVEVDMPTVQARVGKALGYDKPYWWAKRSDAWKHVLADPMHWCHLDTESGAPTAAH